MITPRSKIELAYSIESDARLARHKIAWMAAMAKCEIADECAAYLRTLGFDIPLEKKWLTRPGNYYL